MPTRRSLCFFLPLPSCPSTLVVNWYPAYSCWFFFGLPRTASTPFMVADLFPKAPGCGVLFMCTKTSQLVDLFHHPAIVSSRDVQRSHCFNVLMLASCHWLSFAGIYLFMVVSRFFRRHLVVVWDAWFCEGSKVIFRYGLALLKMYKKRLKALSEFIRCQREISRKPNRKKKSDHERKRERKKKKRKRERKRGLDLYRADPAQQRV